jgi:hypothetical protein
MSWDFQVEMKGNPPLKIPDIGKPQHGIAAMGKDHSFQKMELFLKEAFERGFDQMAAVWREMSRDKRYVGGCAHKTKGKGSSRMKKFLRDIGTKKTNNLAIFRKMRNYFWISPRGYRLDLLTHF